MFLTTLHKMTLVTVVCAKPKVDMTYRTDSGSAATDHPVRESLHFCVTADQNPAAQKSLF